MIFFNRIEIRLIGGMKAAVQEALRLENRLVKGIKAHREWHKANGHEVPTLMESKRYVEELRERMLAKGELPQYKEE